MCARAVDTHVAHSRMRIWSSVGSPRVGVPGAAQPCRRRHVALKAFAPPSCALPLEPRLASRAKPCNLGFASCFLPNVSSQAEHPASEFEANPATENPTRAVTLQLRALHGGPFAHHWLEIESSIGEVTLGFGPATVPFIDAGQVSLQDRYGNIERISGMHPLPVLGLPPLSYRYAKPPGAGHPLGKPIPLTVAQADTLIQKIRHHKFVGPYVPIFHDCRTFACSVQAAAQGRSSIPCYLLFKGYW